MPRTRTSVEAAEAAAEAAGGEASSEAANVVVVARRRDNDDEHDDGSLLRYHKVKEEEEEEKEEKEAKDDDAHHQDQDAGDREEDSAAVAPSAGADVHYEPYEDRSHLALSAGGGGPGDSSLSSSSAAALSSSSSLRGLGSLIPRVPPPLLSTGLAVPPSSSVASSASASAIHPSTIARLTEGLASGGGGTPHHPVSSSFPAKLHRILRDPECSPELIVWLPHGRAWRVRNQAEFESRCLPRYFRHGRFASFLRQVNGWGFKRVLSGADENAYYHEYFIRGLPEISERMRRVGAALTPNGPSNGRQRGGSRRSSSSANHSSSSGSGSGSGSSSGRSVLGLGHHRAIIIPPDFYHISELHPLPDADGTWPEGQGLRSRARQGQDPHEVPSSMVSSSAAPPLPSAITSAAARAARTPTPLQQGQQPPRQEQQPPGPLHPALQAFRAQQVVHQQQALLSQVAQPHLVLPTTVPAAMAVNLPAVAADPRVALLLQQNQLVQTNPAATALLLQNQLVQLQAQVQPPLVSTQTARNGNNAILSALLSSQPPPQPQLQMQMQPAAIANLIQLVPAALLPHALPQLQALPTLQTLHHLSQQNNNAQQLLLSALTAANNNGGVNHRLQEFLRLNGANNGDRVDDLVGGGIGMVGQQRASSSEEGNSGEEKRDEDSNRDLRWDRDGSAGPPAAPPSD